MEKRCKKWPAMLNAGEQYCRSQKQSDSIQKKKAAALLTEKGKKRAAKQEVARAAMDPENLEKTRAGRISKAAMGVTSGVMTYGKGPLFVGAAPVLVGSSMVGGIAGSIHRRQLRKMALKEQKERDAQEPKK